MDLMPPDYWNLIESIDSSLLLDDDRTTDDKYSRQALEFVGEFAPPPARAGGTCFLPLRESPSPPYATSTQT